MSDEIYSGLILSDFTPDNLVQIFNQDKGVPKVVAAAAPVRQVQSLLLNQKHTLWKNREYDFAVIWTQPQAVIEGFNDVLRHKPFTKEAILEEVDGYCSALSNITQHVRFAFVPTWVLPAYDRGLGMLELTPDLGTRNMIMNMNIRLSETLAEEPNLFVLDADRWMQITGARAHNPKLWYMAKIPFSTDVFSEAVNDVKAAINGIHGHARKLIVVDLDDTLWGGIVGDEGWENLKLGGHDFIGEAYADFQHALKALSNRGILLGIVSKNEESTALEAIDKHPEMVLRRNDFINWKINWNDKVQNIIELAKEVNLGLHSVVFLDDNPAERAWVRESLPGVLVPELPEDKMMYRSTLLNLHCFDTPLLSSEDLGRTRMYVDDQRRKDIQKSTTSHDEWLHSLEMKVTIETLSKSNLKRTAQLMNKTNQMNLSTRRMTETELTDWERQPQHKLWVFRVSDKFGDSGLTGIISVELGEQKARIVDFILSCRVMGRKVEETMISRVYHHLKATSIAHIYADFLPTPRNQPCFEFWKQSGFSYDKEVHRFTWPMEAEYSCPETIQIIEEA